MQFLFKNDFMHWTSVKTQYWNTNSSHISIWICFYLIKNLIILDVSCWELVAYWSKPMLQKLAFVHVQIFYEQQVSFSQ